MALKFDKTEVALLGVSFAVFCSSALWYFSIVGLWAWGFPMGVETGGIWVVLLVALLWVSWRFFGADLVRLLCITLGGGLILVCCCWTGSEFLDASTDGQGEHQKRVLDLSNSSEPRTWREWRSAVEKDILYDLAIHSQPNSLNRAYPPGYHPLIINWFKEISHKYEFCHAAWAQVLLSSGKLEAGKGLIFFYSFWLLLFWRVVLKCWIYSSWLAWVIALLVALNPVVICQSLSFFTDSFVAVFFSTALASILLLLGLSGRWKGDDKRTLFVLGGGIFFSCLFLIIGSKASGFGCALFLLLSLTGGLLVIRLRSSLLSKKILVTLTSALMLTGTYLLVSQPGVLGPLIRLIPGAAGLRYSSSGKGIDEGASLFLAGKGKFEQLTVSIFNKARMNPDKPRWKWPFTVYTSELMEFQSLPAEIRIGGFGPYFGPVWLFTLGGLLWLIFTGTDSILSIVWIIVCLFTLSYFTPWWWARWNPWLWLVPILVLLGCCQSGPTKTRDVLVGFLILLMTFDVLLVTFPYFRGAILLRGVMLDQLAYWKTLPQPIPVRYERDIALLHRLADYGITTYRVPGNHFDYQVRVRLPCSGLGIYTNDRNAPWVQELIIETRRLEERMRQFQVQWVLLEVGDEVPSGLERVVPFGYRLKQTSP